MCLACCCGYDYNFFFFFFSICIHIFLLSCDALEVAARAGEGKCLHKISLTYRSQIFLKSPSTASSQPALIISAFTYKICESDNPLWTSILNE